ncbi:GNAT family N-acetyltransferase [bacterium]|nr:GNAT family N-acetyltransferase [bacterium]
MVPIEYKPSMRAEWERFVKESNNGTIFHSQQFLDYHPKGRFQNNHLLFEYRNNIYAIFTGNIKEIEGEKWLFSYSGASYGGLAIHKKLGIKDSVNIVDALVKYARKNKFKGIQLTQTPQIYYNYPNNHVDFALTLAGFKTRKREMSSVLQFDENIEQNFERFKAEARTATRKSMKKGAEVRLSEDWEAYYRILEKNLGMRHNVTPTHTLEELIRLKKLFPNDVLLFGAFKGDTMLAGVVIFICNPKVILAFYISHAEKYQAFRPVNLLFYEIIKWGIEKGFAFLDYGIYTVDMEPNYGLAKFKESFGAKGIFRDTYYIEF